MKPAKARSEIVAVDEIVETLKRVPKTRLQIIRDVVEALANPEAKSKPEIRRRGTKKKSLLDTPFCGMWADRTDIVDGQSFARALRRRLESGGR